MSNMGWAHHWPAVLPCIPPLPLPALAELQLVCLSNVRGIDSSKLSAGAIWVQCEGAMAAVMSGWIQATKIRTLTLLGKQDADASRSFYLLVCLSFLLVALSCAPLLLLPGPIATAFTNDEQVQASLASIVWLLVPHALTRVLCLPFAILLIPMGAKLFAVLTTFACFYAVAVPISTVGALTDLITTSVEVKMGFCLSATSIAQGTALVGAGFYLMFRLDWDAAAQRIANRAHDDRTIPINPDTPAEETAACREPIE